MCTMIFPGDPDPGPWPDWWHRHGRKMRLKLAGRAEVKIAASVASLTITRQDAARDDQPRWGVVWEITHDYDRVRGRVSMTDAELATAFGLVDSPVPPDSWWLTVVFDAGNMKVGKFIVHRDYLNISGPGTGQDGDPNISIRVDDDMRAAIIQIILAARPAEEVQRLLRQAEENWRWIETDLGAG
ncbi:MAG: hypothetical protein AAB360_04150 [Patescibacteria group bacterium]